MTIAAPDQSRDFVTLMADGHTAGVDEAGRGPLAGPVVAAAVILNPDHPIGGLTDSKKLSAAQREVLEQNIRDHAIAWALGRAEVEEIDRINILQATLLAMQRAVQALPLQPRSVLVDGNQCPRLLIQTQAVVKGDLLIPAISAASILAKQCRDREMIELDRLFPAYGFAVHKGYPTRAHLAALDEHGICRVHRRSYAPVRKRMARS